MNYIRKTLDALFQPTRIEAFLAPVTRNGLMVMAFVLARVRASFLTCPTTFFEISEGGVFQAKLLGGRVSRKNHRAEEAFLNDVV